MSKTVGIIGAGVAGLTVAVQLARAGHTLHFFEQNSTVGGKIQEIQQGSYRFDIGPSVITLPHIIRSVLPASYTKHLFVSVNPICTYWWNDRQRFIMTNNVVKNDQQLAEQFGEKHGAYQHYHTATERLYRAIAPVFLTKPIHHPSLFASKLFWKSLHSLPILKLPISLHSYNARFFTNPKALQIFDRFATYNGSSPYRIPSLYSIISYIEIGFGVYLFPHGTRQLVHLLAQYARQLDIEIHTNTPITTISIHKAGTKHTIQSLNSYTQSYQCDVVVNGADYYSTQPLFTSALSVDSPIYTPDVHTDAVADTPHINRPTSSSAHSHRDYHTDTATQPISSNHLTAHTTSTSAIIFLWGISRSFDELSLHNIFFSDDYKQEFRQLFELATIPVDPTIYVNITAKYVKSDAPAGCENWFVMINVPATQTIAWDNVIDYVRHKTIAKLSTILQTELQPHIVCERVLTPPDIGNISNAYHGALYGRNSHGMHAALVRPPNKDRRYRNLYHCGGTVHPGGGIPLSMLSGHIVATLIDKEKVVPPTVPLHRNSYAH